MSTGVPARQLCDPIVDRMQAEIDQALADGDVTQKLSVQRLDAHYVPGPEFAKFVRSESDK